MARTITAKSRQTIGLGKKAAEASAARLAAREADSDEEVSATPLRTSPRRDKRAKSVTQASVASSRGKTADTPSQLVAESQSLLSPAADESPTQGASLQGAPLLSVVH